MPRLILLLLSISFPLAASAQSERQVLGERTIEVSATEKIEVIAEIATIKIGCQNQAATKDAAYAENTRIANKVIQALLDAGVPKEVIETETLRAGPPRSITEPAAQVSCEPEVADSRSGFGGAENRRHRSGRWCKPN